MRYRALAVKVASIAVVSMLLASPAVCAEDVEIRRDAGEFVYLPGAGLRHRATGLTLGGYGNLELVRDDGGPGRLALDALALFVTWDPLSRVHLFSELEGEEILTVDDHGRGGAGTARFTAERLYGDLTVSDALQVRVGKFLTPVGRWNVIHAAPLVWTTSRPLVTRLPFDPHTTGGMLFGAVPGGGGAVGYQLFGQFTDQFAPEPTPQRANHGVGGRLEWGDGGGLSVGGTYLAFSRQRAWRHLTGLDVLWRGEHVEVMGEFVHVVVPRGAATWGLYLQAVAEVHAHLYVVGRYEHFDDASGAPAELGIVGMAWRPWSPVVLKVEYLFADHRVAAAPAGVKSSVAVLF